MHHKAERRNNCLL